VGGFLAFLDPLLRRPTLVVEADDRPVCPRERVDDEAHPRKEFPEVVLHLGGPVPGRGLILEAPVADERGVALSALRPRRSSNSRGCSRPASQVTVAPRNSTRSWEYRLKRRQALAHKAGSSQRP
jgi:hypothetical protein